MSGKGNAIIMYGGGFVDPARAVMLQLARGIDEAKIVDKVFIGQYSFESLFTREFWLEYNHDLEEKARKRRGGFFGTCRGIRLDEEPYRTKSINLLKEENVRLIVVPGGDGSSRNAAKMAKMFEPHGIQVVFAMPLTIDGINGSKVIGRRQAARESRDQIENIVSTSLKTRDKCEFSAAMVELQGRDRDDILARVLRSFERNGTIGDFWLDEIDLFVVPSTIPTDVNKLVEKVRKSKKPTLILLSEGAGVKDERLKNQMLKWSIEQKLEGDVGRKVRDLVVGHPSQCNNQTTDGDEEEYQKWTNFIVNLIKTCPNKKSFSTSLNEETGTFSKRSIGYYAKKNKEGGKVDLPEEDRLRIEKYMVMYPQLTEKS